MPKITPPTPTICNYVKVGGDCCDKCRGYITATVSTNIKSLKIKPMKIAQCKNSSCKCHVVLASLPTPTTGKEEEWAKVRNIINEHVGAEVWGGVAVPSEFHRKINGLTDQITSLMSSQLQQQKERIEKHIEMEWNKNVGVKTEEEALAAIDKFVRGLFTFLKSL